MDYTTLGQTSLKVSVAGLGCGGFSRLGMPSGKSEDEASRLVLDAIELGINVLDTAPAYGTSEARLHDFVVRHRQDLILCSKAGEDFDESGSQFYGEEHKKHYTVHLQRGDEILIRVAFVCTPQKKDIQLVFLRKKLVRKGTYTETVWLPFN